MAIEIVPKPTFRIPLSLNILLGIVLILLLAVLSSYFILAYLKSAASIKIGKTEADISLARNSEVINLERGIKEKKKKIDDFSALISQHLFPSKFFSFSGGHFSETKNFGKLIHPKVQILNVAVDLKNSKVSFSGLTDSFVTLEQQFLIFQQESLVKELRLSGITLNKEGKVNFNFDLAFDPGIFK